MVTDARRGEASTGTRNIGRSRAYPNPLLPNFSLVRQFVTKKATIAVLAFDQERRGSPPGQTGSRV